MANDNYIFGGLLLLFIAFAAMGGGDDKTSPIQTPRFYGGGPSGREAQQERQYQPFTKADMGLPDDVKMKGTGPDRQIPAWLIGAFDGYQYLINFYRHIRGRMVSLVSIMDKAVLVTKILSDGQLQSCLGLQAEIDMFLARAEEYQSEFPFSMEEYYDLNNAKEELARKHIAISRLMRMSQRRKDRGADIALTQAFIDAFRVVRESSPRGKAMESSDGAHAPSAEIPLTIQSGDFTPVPARLVPTEQCTP